MIKQTTQQFGGVAKSAVKQILQEPVEIAKAAGEQVAPLETGSGQQQPAKPQKQVQPSLEEQKKNVLLQAHRRELDDQIKIVRQKREEREKQEQMIEEKSVEEKKKEKEIENQSIFQKGLNLVRKRLQRRTETRLPKAA